MMKKQQRLKMPPIMELKQRFLSMAPKNGFSVAKSITLPDDLERIVSMDAARSDVAMFAALLIQAYGGDIYVLTNNRSASASETTIAYLKYNPHTKLIGTHTSGCDQYVHFRPVVLAGPGIVLRLPLVYREIHHVKSQNFEMNGWAPDIECAPGTDAMDVAMQDLSVTRMMTANNKGHNK